MLNVALFGITAKQWKGTNPDAKDNMRDKASIEQLVVYKYNPLKKLQ